MYEFTTRYERQKWRWKKIRKSTRITAPNHGNTMIDGKIKKGFLLDYNLDYQGALNDPRSLQKMSYGGWNTGIDMSKGAWGSISAGNGGWCIHLPCDRRDVQL